MTCEPITIDAKHPMFDHHRILGRPVLPGLAYPDLIFQMAAERGIDHACSELRNLTILEPMVIDGEGALRVTVLWEPLTPTTWRVVVESIAADAAAGTVPLRHAVAELWETGPHAFDTAVSTRTNDAPIVVPLSACYADFVARGLVHGPSMRAQGTVSISADGAIVDIAPEDRSDAHAYLFHPALLDGSGIGSGRLFATLYPDEKALYLPLTIGRFRASRPLRGHIVAEISAAAVRHRRELASLDIVFRDADKTIVAELQEVTCKAVRESGLRAPRAVTSARTVDVAARSGSAYAAVAGLVAARSDVPVDADTGFYDLGLDSSALLSIADAIAARVGAALPPTLLFEHGNTGELAHWLERQYPAAFDTSVEPTSATARTVVATPERAVDTAADIAVIGMAGRYPDAEDIAALWRNLCEGHDAIVEVPASRWRPDSVAGITSPSGKPVSRWGGFVEGPQAFDARFFRITPREAEVMDPQERLFLETAWTAMEDAGHTPDSLARGSNGEPSQVGVFVGVMQSDYAFVQHEAGAPGTVPVIANRASVANRVSYACDFHGPSMVVDTACSSSLVAIDLAVRSLRDGTCATAIAGGVNLSLRPEKYIACALMDMHSSEGRCRAFGDGGDGYVSAEGVGAVVLKPLAAAVADGDRIYGVIRASAVGHGGSSAGIMAPNPESQARLISQCLQAADISARDIGYVEAHGTGTSLGDPIEIEGLSRAFRAHTADTQYCAIGSIKSCIGHAEAAAGIAGLCKLLLQLGHGQLAPSLHCDPPNPRIDFASSPFRVQRALAPWPAMTGVDGLPRPRLGAISAFGASGTNVHMVVEEYVATDPVAPVVSEPAASVVVLSAIDDRRLRRQAERLLAFVEATHDAAAETPAQLLAGILGIAVDVLDTDADWHELGLDDGQLRLFADRLDAWSERNALSEPVPPALELLTAHRNLRALSRRLGGERDSHAVSLRALCYTLQIGRVASRERLAFAVGSVVELANALRAYLADSPELTAFRGTVTADGMSHSGPRIAVGLRNTEIAAAWSSGVPIEWIEHYAKPLPHRIAAPTTVFDRRDYWVGTGVHGAPAAGMSVENAVPAPEISVPASPAHSPARDRHVQTFVHRMLAAATRLDAADIHDTLEFEEIGLDSLMIQAMAREIEAAVGEADSTVFFRCRTVGALARHLANAYPHAWNETGSGAVSSAAAAADELPVASTPPRTATRRDEPMRIAIIGLAGRYPKADDLDAFWRNLRDGRDCVEVIPPQRWSLEGFFEPDPFKATNDGRSYAKWGAFLEGVDRFDPLFFNITPREARLMDPHERLFLETAWACIEDAGCTRASLRAAGRVGVYVGASFNNYQLIMSDAAAANGAAHYAAASQIFSIANRVSYALDLIGPSLTIDTACSSSLYAIHLACEAIASGDIALAVAGGVNLSLHPSKYVSLSLGRFLATDGRCRAFDEGGTGYVPGEAVGAVLLKPLDLALRDGDPIHGVVLASAANHGGRSNGYSVPDPAAQAAVIGEALDRAGIDVRTISHVEAHGTGTALGDPVEVAGLTQAFHAAGAGAQSCALSSVKTMIGHSEAAAGIAQLTKVLLEMRHGTLIRNLSHGDGRNPAINFEKTPFYVVDSNMPWTAVRDGVRRAGISSFGAGGANAHLILEQAPSANEQRRPDQGEPMLFVLSARSDDSLRAYARRLSLHLAAGEYADAALTSIACTLQSGREAMEHRIAFVADRLVDAIEILGAFADRHACEGVVSGRARRIRSAQEDLNDASRPADASSDASLLRLGRAWVDGASVDWSTLWPHARPRRIPLPTYPFAHESYWVPGVPPEAARAVLHGHAGSGRNLPGAAETARSTAKVESRTQKRVAQETEPAMGSNDRSETLIVKPEWQAAEAVALPAARARAVILLCDVPDALLAAAHRHSSPHESVISLSAGDSDIVSRYRSHAIALCECLASIAPADRASTCVQLVISSTHSPMIDGLVAALRTSAMEMPALHVQCIDFQAWPESEMLFEVLRRERGGETYIRIVDGQRRIRAWREISPDPARAFAWKREAVLLITGGAGGLGAQIVEEIGRTRPDVTLVLTGRSMLDASRSGWLSALRAGGMRVEYLRTDIADAGQCEALIADVCARHARLDGVIHCAGVIRDNFIVRKPASEFEEVLAPKVAGTFNLDRATHALPLDAFVCFSSGAGAIGNLGQCDYAMANAFMDSFAAWRRERVECGERYGHTVSIGWPVWRDGGMRLDAATIDMMEKSAGMRPLEFGQGMRALADCLAMDEPYALVASGDVAKLRRLLIDAAAPGNRPAQSAPTGDPMAHDDAELNARVVSRLARMLADTIEIPVERIDPREPLDRYGLDSVVVMEMNRTLSGSFEMLSQTLFFDCSDLGEVGAALVLQHRAECTRWTGMGASSGEETAIGLARTAATSSNEATDAAFANGHEGKQAMPSAVQREGGEEAIAIIGMAGRYPQASDLDAFWDRLKAGIDCIGEIPEARWPLAGFFDADRGRAVANGKSYSRWGGFLEDWDRFEPDFFHMSPLEAVNLDPQIRLFMECCWNTLEDAGYTRRDLTDRYRKRVGVFAGITKTGYALHGPEVWPLNQHYNPQTSFSALVNRVSYAFDVQGPSLAFDTMCSSSLTAIHEACGKLRSGDCELALAGGVNLYLHPSNYLELCGVQMLSADGRCKSFGAGADGFVPGEGVGAVLLKPLSRAIADGDNIHAVIRATGINHGGKVNGFTVPNPRAQRDLIRDTLDRAGIAAGQIGCVEAHGTGTDLGDPIEVSALAQSFAMDTTARGFCSLGSIKSNIGHLEAAAGIAGLTKVVLQLKHRTLVPTLHASTPNPRIRFEETPFVLQQQLTPWEREDDRLIATVSSFGAGGANAFAVLERHAHAEPEQTSTDRQIVVLSARDRTHLVMRAKRLLQTIETSLPGTLADIAYTLQTGREPMAERIALLVDSVDDLRDQLRVLVGNGDEWHPEALDTALTGRIEEGATQDALLDDSDIRDTISTWFRKGKLRLVAHAWTKGFDIDWHAMHRDRDPRRVSLPGYPFAGNRLALPKGRRGASATAVLHPLLHRNVSTLQATGFVSRFEAEAPFLRDHRVLGRPVFPAVAYLGMAHAALAQLVEQPGDWRLSDIVWVRPAHTEGEALSLGLTAEATADGRIALEIRREGAGDASAILMRGYASRALDSQPPARDLAMIAADCRKRIEPESSYRTFSGMGLEYGPGFRTLGPILCGEGMAMCELQLPAEASEWPDDLLPGLLDGALQATLGLSPESLAESPLVPFSLASMQVHGPRPQRVLCVVERAPAGHGSEALEIALHGQDGRVWLSMSGFVARRLERLSPTAGELLMFVPEWRAEPGAADGHPFEGRVVFCCDARMRVMDQAAVRTIASPEADLPEAARYASAVRALLREARTLSAQRKVPPPLFQVVVPDHPAWAPFCGLNGVLKTLSQENPAFHAQLLIVDPAQSPEDLSVLLDRESRNAAPQVRHRSGAREVAGWREWMVGNDLPAPPPWRDAEVYVISGGSGALAAKLANDILDHAPTAKVVLLGRRALDIGDTALARNGIEYLQADCSQARALGRTIDDVIARHGRIDGLLHLAGITRDSFAIKKTDSEVAEVLNAKVDSLIALDAATARVSLRFFVVFASVAGQTGNPGQADYAAANGFLDGFAVHRNALVARGERRGPTCSIDWPLWEEGGMGVNAATAEVLAQRTGMRALPVAQGLRALHRILDVACPQVMPIFGDASQLRATLLPARPVPAPDLDAAPTAAATRDVRSVVAGLLGVPTADVDDEASLGELGADTFVLSKIAQLLGKSIASSTRIGSLASTADEARPLLETEKMATVSSALDLERVAFAMLVERISEVTHMPPERFAPDKPIDGYGIDSVAAMQATAKLEQVFGTLSKTLFFEFPTLREMAAHFSAHHAVPLQRMAGPPPAAAMPPAAGASQLAARILANSATAAETSIEASIERRSLDAAADGIAIIGVAGRYPMADELDTFWDNLRSGRDCVGEIPADRWDHSRFFDPAKGKLGKTYCARGGFLSDVARFDASFFGISPREAQIMDPQERLFLECTHHVLEDAGYTRRSLGAGRAIGVFVGVMYEEYQLYGVERMMQGAPVALAGNPAAIANRVSYFCDFRGPSMAVDTMCSSSLTAIHLACRSLRDGECDAAVAGGVNLSLHPNKYLMLAQGRFASSIGRCESFGAGGDGYVPSEGVGAVLLKPLAKAIADGDRIHGVIRGSALNHGGRTNGYTVPNPNAQADVIAKAIAKAGIDARTIGYIEAHGTGTTLGDPIEIAGLARAFSAHTDDKQFCAIGSVKSNIGHGESAAGIAGLTKVLLQMRHGVLAPSLHADVLNANIDFANSPFVVQTGIGQWVRQSAVDGQGRSVEQPLRAGLSSFGAGGANAHLLIEEYIAPAASVHAPGPQAIPLSARKPERLRAQAARLRDHLLQGRHLDAPLSAIADTLKFGREPMEERLCVVAASVDALCRSLDRYLDGVADQGIVVGHADPDRPELEAYELRALSVDGPAALARAWVDGLFSDWNALHVGPRPTPVGLPGYAFAETRYWVPDLAQLVKAAARHEASTIEESAQSTPPSLSIASHERAVSPRAPDPATVEVAAKRLQRTPVALASLDVQPAIAVLPAKPKASIVLAPTGDTKTLATDRSNPVSADVSFATPAAPAAASRPLPSASAIHDAGPLREALRRLLAEALFAEAEEIDPEVSFVDLGVDSIIGVEWIKAVNRQFGTTIQATRIYEHPTLDRMASFVGETLRGANATLPTTNAGTSEADVAAASAAAGSTVPAAVSATRLDELMADATGLLAEALFCAPDEISLDATFQELGVDSVIGVEWVHAVNRRHGMSIPATRVYEYPTLRAFVTHLLAPAPMPDAMELPASAPTRVPTPAAPSVVPPARIASMLPLDELLEQVGRGELSLADAEHMLESLLDDDASF